MRYIRFILLCLVVSRTAFASTVQLDPETGLWFPPDATREDYLSMKAPYGRHLMRAFREDAQVARDVCAAFQARKTKIEPASHPAGRQLVMLETSCMSIALAAVDMQNQEATDAVTTGFLDKLLTEAVTFAANVPAEERRARHEATIAAAEQATRDDDWLRLALQGIALRPQNSRGAHLLLSRSRAVNLESGVYPARTLAGYAEQIYRQRLNDANWRSGFPEVLLYRGKLEEARALLAELIDAETEGLSYDRIALAVVNDMASRDNGIASIAARCDQSCWFIVYSIAVRTVRALGDQAPARTAEILLATSRNTTDQAMKLAIARELTTLDPAAAARESTTIASREGASHGEVLDAMRSLAEAEHRSGNTLRAIALLDCWIARRFGAIGEFAADGWRQIAQRLRASDDRPEKVCAEDPNAAMCVYGALLTRYSWAMARGRHDLARQSVEMLASAVLERRLKASTIPGMLMTMAADLSALGATDAKTAATKIAAYVAAQPHDSTAAHNLKSYPRLLSTVALEPFVSPAVVTDLPAVCRNGTFVN